MDSSNAAKTGKRTKTTTVDTEDFTSRSHKDVRSGKKRFSDGPATVDEVLAWLLEQLALQGAVGLSTNWRPGHFSSMFSVSANDLDTFSEFPNNGADLTTGLGGAIRDHSRESWLGEVTTQHRALFPKVVTLVESKLLAHGIAREKFRKLNPRDKLIMLAEANLPKAPNLPTITLYLVVSKDVEGDANESKPLAFPRDVTFVHFQAVLRDLTDDSAIRAGRTSGYTLLDGPWRYQLLGRDKDIVPGLPKFEIADEADFRQMIRQLSDKDTPSACIYHSLVARLHEKRIDFHAMVSLQDTFGDIEEVDEDGNPYFKALDWKSLSASGIGGSGILARPVRKLVVSGWNKSS